MSAYSTAVLADNPLLYLRLDETSGTTCANSGSLGGNATCQGTVTRNVTAPHANLGVAVTLQGVGDDDYISYPDTSALDLTGDFTYELWAQASTSGTYQLMGKSRDNSSTSGLRFVLAGAFIRVYAGATIIAAGGTWAADGNWHHLVATRSGSAVVIYLDGTSVATGTDSTAAQATTQPFIIGAWLTETGFSFGFPGSVDEVAVYNTGLSSTRVAAHYAAYNAAATTPVADFTGTPTSGAASLSVTFTDSSTNTPTSWAWTFGDGGTSTSQNPTHSYTVPGVYTVTLIATNSGGSNTKTRTSYITVTEPIVYAAGGGIEIY